MTPLMMDLPFGGYGLWYALLVGTLLLACLLGLAALSGIDRWQAHRDGLRAALRAQLESLNLGGMIERHGIALDRYLRRQPALVVEVQMARCQSCSQRRRCDQFLQGAGGDAAFCPNAGELRRFAEAPPAPGLRRYG